MIVMGIQVFNAEHQAFTDIEVTTKAQAQDVADTCINGAYVQVYIGVHTIGRSTSQNKQIDWY